MNYHIHNFLNHTIGNSNVSEITVILKSDSGNYSNFINNFSFLINEANDKKIELNKEENCFTIKILNKESTSIKNYMQYITRVLDINGYEYSINLENINSENLKLTITEYLDRKSRNSFYNNFRMFKLSKNDNYERDRLEMLSIVLNNLKSNKNNIYLPSYYFKNFILVPIDRNFETNYSIIRTGMKLFKLENLLKEINFADSPKYIQNIDNNIVIKEQLINYNKFFYNELNLNNIFYDLYNANTMMMVLDDSSYKDEILSIIDNITDNYIKLSENFYEDISKKDIINIFNNQIYCLNKLNILFDKSNNINTNRSSFIREFLLFNKDHNFEKIKSNKLKGMINFLENYIIILNGINLFISYKYKLNYDVIKKYEKLIREIMKYKILLTIKSSEK